MSHDKDVLKPQPQDIVAIKMAGDIDFKMGVVTGTFECPHIKVRTLTGGRRDERLIHSLNLGLLYRDPPSQSSSEIAAENEAHERAANGLRKAWEDQPAHKIESERCKLVKIHEDQIKAGLHRGRINLSTGLTKPYFIVDLPTPDEVQKNVTSSHQQEDAKFRKKVFDQIKQNSNPIVSLKTNLYLDRFISLTASETPVACQRDLSGSNFNILTFGMRVPRPKKFHLPSSYLAHTIFPKDIRIDTHGQLWINKFMWRPAIDSFSPIEVFPFASALGVANARSLVPPDADAYNLPSTSKFASLVPTNADTQNQISASTSAWLALGQSRDS